MKKLCVLIVLCGLSFIKGAVLLERYAHCEFRNQDIGGHICFMETTDQFLAQIMLTNLPNNRSVEMHIHERSANGECSEESVGGHVNLGNDEIDEGELAQGSSSVTGTFNLQDCNVNRRLSLAENGDEGIIGKSVVVHYNHKRSCCDIELITAEMYERLTSPEDLERPHHFNHIHNESE